MILFDYLKVILSIWGIMCLIAIFLILFRKDSREVLFEIVESYKTTSPFEAFLFTAILYGALPLTIPQTIQAIFLRK